MELKSKIKNLIKMTQEKQIIPIEHIVDKDELLQDKVAVIIGGSGGIGLAIAKSFVESGCKVVLCGTNEKKLESCLEGFVEKDKVRTMVFNVADVESMRSDVEKAVKAFGKVDILVNSAGVHSENVSFFTMVPDEFDRVMNINLRGPFFLCQAFAEYMTKDKSVDKKHILLVSSSRGSEPAWSQYGISKWALNGLTQGLAQMLLPHDIIVNAIAPGSTATELIGVKEGDSITITENKVGRLAMPDEIANLAKLLVSPAGDMIVGETVHISGGRGVIDIR